MTQGAMEQVTWNFLRTIPIPITVAGPYTVQVDISVSMVLAMQVVLCSRLGAEASIETGGITAI